MAGPLGIAKATFFITDGRYSWTESYYNTNGMTDGIKATQTALGAIMLQAVRLARFRAAMLPSSTVTNSQQSTCTSGSFPQLVYIRISQVGSPRNTLFFDPSGSTLTSSILQTNRVPPFKSDKLLQLTQADNPYSGVQMELSLNNGLTSKRVLSGVPDNSICDQTVDSSSDFATLFNVFAAELVNTQWGVISSSVTANNNGSVPAGAVPILAWSADDPVFCRPTITVGSAWPAATTPQGCGNQYVQVICYKSNPGPFPNLNGIYRIGTTTSGTLTTGSGNQPSFSFQINKSFKCFNPFFNGYVIPYAGPKFVDITGAQITGAVLKKRGGSFGQPHGRRRIVK